ncbi:MAG: hypothetical protein GF341_12830, partial [candidate division Zixibacteria bacterium]|nr:hypothetical protein [candidate division Zixibacteria bacterium]
LLVLTVITVLAAQVDLGAWNIVVALLIASVKASLVAFIFMHLYYDNKLYFLIFVVSVAFLALLIGLSMADTERRADLYEEVGKPIREHAIIYTTAADTTAGTMADTTAGTAADTTATPADTLSDTTAADTHSESSSH